MIWGQVFDWPFHPGGRGAERPYICISLTSMERNLSLSVGISDTYARGRTTNTWNFIADYDIISMYLKLKVVTIIKGVL